MSASGPDVPGSCEQCDAGEPMDVTRRELAKGIGMAALSGLAPGHLPAPPAGPLPPAAVDPLPARRDFTVGRHETCLNNARWHPISIGARAAVIAYLDYKARGIWQPPDPVSDAQRDVKLAFAGLINADADEIAYVNSTTTAESLLVAGLGVHEPGVNIVTDALHFEGSLYMYTALQRQGVDVRIVRPRDWRIQLEDMAAVIDDRTRLVALSQVSYINGFQHDVKAVCDLAHAHGAFVYADAVQAAGAVPIDVRASGVDAMACASYKWLMGDMGLGFLYVRRQSLPRLTRTQFGYRQLSDFQYHAFPWDQPGQFPVDWTQRADTAGQFEVGTYANTTIAALSHSVPYLRRLGVERIRAHSRALIDHLQAELPKLGHPSITPVGSDGPIASFLVSDVTRTTQVLKQANVDVSLSPGRMRISPSVYNDHADVERLLAALRTRTSR